MDKLVRVDSILIPYGMVEQFEGSGSEQTEQLERELSAKYGDCIIDYFAEIPMDNDLELPYDKLVRADIYIHKDI